MTTFKKAKKLVIGGDKEWKARRKNVTDLDVEILTNIALVTPLTLVIGKDQSKPTETTEWLRSDGTLESAQVCGLTVILRSPFTQVKQCRSRRVYQLVLVHT